MHAGVEKMRTYNLIRFLLGVETQSTGAHVHVQSVAGMHRGHTLIRTRKRKAHAHKSTQSLILTRTQFYTKSYTNTHTQSTQSLH